MKIILLQDVPNVGRKWDVRDEKGGYARNFLLARKLAILATPKNIKEIELRKKQENLNKTVQSELLDKNIEILKNSSLTIERRANEKGNLFDGVDAKEILEEIKEKLNFEIPLEIIEIKKPIKELGKHKITLRKGESETSFEIEIKPKEN